MYVHRRIFVAVVSVGMISVHALAVEPGKPSKTSIVTAAARAIGSHDPDPSVRNPDWLAERFLGPEERAVLPDLPLMLGLTIDYQNAMKDRLTSSAVPNMIVRTRFMDEQLEKAVSAGATQVVILGAGFDSRAYRLRQLLRNAKVFEIDYGPTQEYKKRRVKEVLGAWPTNLVYVPIDFTKEKLGNVLRNRGYRPSQKSFFIWEGVTMYIPEEAVRETFQFISRNSAGASSVVFDYYTKSFVEKSRGPTDQRASWGEPVIFGLPDGAEQEFIGSSGLDLAERLMMSGAESVRRYLTRKDGSIVGSPSSSATAGQHWLVVAKVRVSSSTRKSKKCTRVPYGGLSGISAELGSVNDPELPARQLIGRKLRRSESSVVNLVPSALRV